MIQQEQIDSAKQLVYWMGVALVGAGGLSLVYLAMSLIQLIHSPAGSDLVNWVFSSLLDNEVLLSGHLDRHVFEIKISEKVQYLLIGLLGLIAIGVFAKVVGILIEGGITLIRFSVKDSESKKTDS